MEVEFDPKLKICPLCGSSSLAAYDRDFRSRTIDRCRGCGVDFLNPQYSDGYLERFYSARARFDHREGLDVPLRKRKEVHETGKRRALDLVAQYVEVGRLLSVGTADGLEVYTAQEKGWEVEGFEVSQYLVEELRARFGIEMHTGPFQDLPDRNGYYDAVFIDQVLEHVKNPEVYLRKIHQLLRPGGVMYLGLPNVTSWSNRMKTLIGRLGLRTRKRGKHYATQHHLVYYSPAVLERVLPKRYGFEVLRMRGALKPSRQRLSTALGRFFVNANSGFLIVARRRD
jgi:2-polyprenyl-3-methyl-5-hydroxy-6-metoxy-1,4-benzoquinol methylase